MQREMEEREQFITIELQYISERSLKKDREERGEKREARREKKELCSISQERLNGISGQLQHLLSGGEVALWSV